MCAMNCKEEIGVVIIDDNEDHRTLLETAVKDAFGNDHRRVVCYMHDAPDVALADLPTTANNVVFLDYRLANGSGLDWINDFLRADVGPIVIVTSSGDEDAAVEAFRRGAADYVTKTSLYDRPGTLRKVICEALRRSKLERTNRELSRSLKMSNAELERNNIRLAELMNTAHRFVEDVAHEFRTPLAVIKEFASILADGLGGDVSEQQLDYLAFIIDSSRELASLIDDFLDTSKLQSCSLRVERRECDLAQMFENSRRILESRAMLKDVTIECDIPEGLPHVYADEEKARRSLVNLVVNAIKFSPQRSAVSIRAAHEGDYVRVSVTDHGPGLDEDAVKTLFERFAQAGAGRRSDIKGFGLGLNIVRELTALNLGDAHVESVLDEGSTFSFTMPVNERSAILGAFLRRLRAFDPNAHLCAMSVKREADTQSIQELRSDLAGLTQSMDLVLPAPNDACLIVVGESNRPDEWKERLVSVDEQHRSRALGPDPGPLAIRLLGQWPVRAATEPLEALLTTPTAHDTKHPHAERVHG